MTDWSLVCSFFAARRKLLEAQCHVAEVPSYDIVFEAAADVWATLKVNEERGRVMMWDQRGELALDMGTMAEAVHNDIIASFCDTPGCKDHGGP